MIDTCQAGSMFTTFYSPNIVATGSSSVSEDSLSVSSIHTTASIMSSISHTKYQANC